MPYYIVKVTSLKPGSVMPTTGKVIDLLDAMNIVVENEGVNSATIEKYSDKDVIVDRIFGERHCKGIEGFTWRTEKRRNHRPFNRVGLMLDAYA